MISGFPKAKSVSNHWKNTLFVVKRKEHGGRSGNIHKYISKPHKATRVTNKNLGKSLMDSHSCWVKENYQDQSLQEIFRRGILGSGGGGVSFKVSLKKNRPPLLGVFSSTWNFSGPKRHRWRARPNRPQIDARLPRWPNAKSPPNGYPSSAAMKRSDMKHEILVDS